MAADGGGTGILSRLHVFTITISSLLFLDNIIESQQSI